jgi:hypothetical protein
MATAGTLYRGVEQQWPPIAIVDALQVTIGLTPTIEFVGLGEIDTPVVLGYVFVDNSVTPVIVAFAN